MSEFIAILTFAWLCALIATTIAQRTKRSARDAFFLGLLLGPIGIIGAFALPRVHGVKCRWCRSLMLAADATVCAQCGREQTDHPDATPRKYKFGRKTQDEKGNHVACPICGKVFLPPKLPGVYACPHCRGSVQFE